jgi:hypothetical protein
LENVLGKFKADPMIWTSILKESQTLSHAEVDQAGRDAVKDAILNDQETVTEAGLVKFMKERKLTHAR